jgi:hypothetical protein
MSHEGNGKQSLAEVQRLQKRYSTKGSLLPLQRFDLQSKAL